MDAKEKYTQLLADENFQDDIRNYSNLSNEDQQAILRKYSITEKELIYARRLLTGVSFKQEKVGSLETQFALKRLMMRIKDGSSPSEKTRGRKVDLMNWMLRIAAVLSIPLLLSTIYFYQKSTALNADSQLMVTQNKTINTFTAPAGAKTQVVLPDGSVSWLNSGSSLSVPATFEANRRELSLTGEAYFEVVKNEQAPMFVSTDQMTVKVYGTKFNVNAFGDDGTIRTTLVEGKVTLIPEKSTKEYLLEPGFTASYDLQSKKIKANEVEKMDAFTGWKDGKLLFQNEPFADIVNRLERWYNVDIQLSDPSLGNYNLYATFIDENIEQVLAIFASSIPIEVDYPKRKKQADGSYARREIVIKRDVNKVIN
jgi:ferric-dicitrate binding protein FerR (iron transport regulator)